MTKKALVSGITGQDGSYLAELLLKKGYQVHGLVRRQANPYFENIKHLLKDIKLHHGDLCDASSLALVVRAVDPDEVYNLAAQSHVGTSFGMPEFSLDVNGTGVLRLLEAVYANNPDTKFYQASTSELYGANSETPQNEDSPFAPVSPYAIGKIAGYWSTIHYRDSYDMFACNGILFNHESPRRGKEFVTQKIAKHIARMINGDTAPLELGNLSAKRDWGHAKEYVEAMWRMMQQDSPGDYVIATGKSYSVKELVELAFDYAGITLQWEETEHGEFGHDKESGILKVISHFDSYRPTDVNELRGDPGKAKVKMGWKAKTGLKELIHEMIEYNLERA